MVFVHKKTVIQDVTFLSSMFQTTKSIFIPRLTAEPSLQFIIISPYNQMPEVNLISPSNIIYSSITNHKVASKWSKNVSIANIPLIIKRPKRKIPS